MLSSLVFYAWGEVFYVSIMILSICSNYFFGLQINKVKKNNAKKLLIFGISINIILLISFKYANFITDNLNILFYVLDIKPIYLNPVHLPLGISFFTFQAISYLVDVFRKQAPAQKNIFDLALYISLFPQLIAGPIVRYNDIALQLRNRLHSTELFSSGIHRFICGFAKKILIANSLGEVVDSVFILTGGDLTLPLAWIGVLSYTLQIYFDFSGYSDMAIGLGRMFGFRFLENFNYPYISTSIREFWRRWHISLSTWFRDYVYIPLGGNRVSTVRVYSNLLGVFILTGFWHGASWNFLIWGLFHGFFLAGEHAGFSLVLKNLWKPFQHFYSISIATIGWVFFRSDTLSYSISYLGSMIDISKYHTTSFQLAQVLSYEAVVAFVFGMIFSTPLYPRINIYFDKLSDKSSISVGYIISFSRLFFLTLILLLSISKMASSTYNPFIYFRF